MKIIEASDLLIQVNDKKQDSKEKYPMSSFFANSASQQLQPSVMSVINKGKLVTTVPGWVEEASG